MKVQLLNKKKHDRKKFDCGINTLNNYLNQTARQHDDIALSRTYVLTHSESSSEILAYYSLTVCHIHWDDIPEDLQKRYPSNGISAALIGRLAVDKRSQGKQYGTIMVIDAIKRIVSSSSALPHPVIIIDAINKRAKDLYIKFGFEEISPNSMRLYMPMTYARDMLY